MELYIVIEGIYGNSLDVLQASVNQKITVLPLYCVFPFMFFSNDVVV